MASPRRDRAHAVNVGVTPVWSERPGFRLVHYSLQGNHAHLIVEARDAEMLGRGMMAIGSRLARAVNRVAGRSGRVLADRYHARLLRRPKEVRAAPTSATPNSASRLMVLNH